MTDSRGRVERRDEVAQERRRRTDDTLDGNQAQRLAIPEEVRNRLRAEGRTPRWINDEGNRLHNLTKRDDYDRVDGVEPVPVGTTKEGKPILSYLHSKPVAFIAEDMAKKDAGRRVTELSLMQGRVAASPNGSTNPLPGDVTYADVANRLDRGSQAI